MTVAKKNKGGAPTREQRTIRDLTEALKTMAATQERHQTLLEEILKRGDGPEEKEVSRTVESPRADFEPATVPQTPAGEPATVFKCRSRGLRLVLKSSYTIERGNGNYRTIPPVCADFENGTFRTNDEEVIAVINGIIEDRKRMGKMPIVVKVEGEAAARLQNPETDKRAKDLEGEGADLDEVKIIS